MKGVAHKKITEIFLSEFDSSVKATMERKKTKSKDLAFMKQETCSKHRFAKRTILHRKTHHFRTQNAPFYIAKRTILERKTHRFRKRPDLLWNANSIQLDF